MPFVSIELHVHTHTAIPPEVLSELRAIRADLANVINREGKMQTDLSALQAAVAAETSADQSAITLLEGLKAALDAAGTDPVALKVLSDQLASNASALAAAVTANTPAPAPAPVDTGGNGSDTIVGGQGDDTTSGV